MKALGLLAAFFLLTWLSTGRGGDPPENEHVKLNARTATSSVRPGAAFELEFRFLPVEGIHVNADPPVEFSLDSTETALSLRGAPVMTTDEATGYLSVAEPVRQTIVLDAGTRPGERKVKGIVTYFFCSDSEGWCNRRKQPVEFTVMVTP